MSSYRSGAPPGPDVKRADLGRESARGIAPAGATNRTPPLQKTQRLALPSGAYRLLEMRLRGRVPVGSVLIAADRNIGKAWPCRLVVGHDDPASLDFSMCAGLRCVVAGRDTARIDAIAQAVGRFKPKSVIVADYSAGRLMAYAPKSAPGNA